MGFLYTEITHHEDGTLSTTVYRKKTHTDKYLSFDSHHPLSHKVSVARTLFSRAEKVCSTVGERDNERKHVTDALRANGYPMNIIEMNAQSRQRPRQGRTQTFKKGGYFVTTPRPHPLKIIITETANSILPILISVSVYSVGILMKI